MLAHLVVERGPPAVLRSDNGTAFIARPLLEWTLELGIHLGHIDTGKPWQNGTDESFNGRFRDECLNAEWFRPRALRTDPQPDRRGHFLNLGLVQVGSTCKKNRCGARNQPNADNHATYKEVLRRFEEQTRRFYL